MGELQQVGIVTKYELLKHLRRKRLYAVLLIAAVVGFLQPIVPIAFNIAFPEKVNEWASSFFNFANLLIVIAGAFFAGDAISSEFEHRTGYIIFPNPVKRTSLVFGKFIAACISVLLTISLYYAIGVGAVFSIYNMVPLETATSFAYAVLYILCVLGLTFLFSSFLKGSMGATLLSFFLLFLIMPIFSSVITLTGTEPWFIPTYAAGMTTQVLNPQEDRVISIPGNPVKIYMFYPKFPISLIVLVVYFAVAFILSLILVDRKDMT